MSVDLTAYFQRIGYTGPREPTLSVLTALMNAHVQAIPFENLDVVLGTGVDLAPEALFDKLVRRRRGGYCFEQNGLFEQVLNALGFAVRPLSARVRLTTAPGQIPPRTHLFLEVTLDGTRWLADVGIGAFSLAAPLRFTPDEEQRTPHEPRRIVREGEHWLHQARLGDSWTDVYEFTGEEMPPIDREVANWYTSAHPRSHFRDNLMVARALPDGERVTLRDSELKHRGRDGQARVRTIRSPDELLEVLATEFGLVLPPGTPLRPGASAPS
ncbi:MAG TPA: arylamine N-acetyltransferase [Polyangia bacterium]|nr:arylamine N-acetyltransferase [Polyangia bacterium]